MLIGFDLTFADINQAGTGIYTGSLAKALTEYNTCSSIHFFSARQTRDISKPKSLHTRLDTLYRDLVWMHIILPSQARRVKVDLLHLPANLSPIYSPCPVVLSILDTTVYQNPEFFPAWQRNYFLTFGPRSARNAARIITISESSKADIVKIFRLPAEKVTAIPIAVSPKFQVLEREQIQLKKDCFNLDKYILTVGTIEPRKNLDRLIDAFALLNEEFPGLMLVHAGPNGWHMDHLLPKIKQMGLTKLIRFLGKVSLTDLIFLYNAAELFIYPSLYEGFGLPVLEAMACGCPVVTSNTSSLPEVAGDAAVMVDPYLVESIAKGIEGVLRNPNLAKELRQLGLFRAQKFSWQKTALETLKVYHEVAGT